MEERKDFMSIELKDSFKDTTQNACFQLISQ